MRKQWVLGAAAAGVVSLASVSQAINRPAGGLTAGLVPQNNWNDVTGKTGTAVPLKDATGATTPVTLSFVGAGTWSTAVANNPLPSPNQILMNGYVDGTDNGHNTYTFNNVPAGTYSLVVYTEPDGLDGRTEDFTLNGTGQVFVASKAGANYNTFGFVQAKGTSKTDPLAVGNYVEYTNISPDANGALTLVGTSDTFRNFSNGLQLLNSSGNPFIGVNFVGGAATFDAGTASGPGSTAPGGLTVPEPTSLGLLGLAGVAVLARQRRSA